jgi:L-alanine-DL-glutamate epimerase-like enolase superfamily enzyme
LAAPTLSGHRGLGGLTLRSIEAIPYVVPLVRPIAWARGRMSAVDNVLVRVTLSDGTQGIADAPARPTILGETQKSIVAIIAGSISRRNWQAIMPGTSTACGRP